MIKKIKIELSTPKAWGMITETIELCGVKCVETFKKEKLASWYGKDAKIVDVQDDPQAETWAKAYEQDKDYLYNG